MAQPHAPKFSDWLSTAWPAEPPNSLRQRGSPAHPRPCRYAPPPTLEVNQRSKTPLSTLVLCETTVTSGHTVTGATRERQRATTTRDDDNEERRDTAGKVVLPPPSPEVRGHWLDLAITDLADPTLMTRTAVAWYLVSADRPRSLKISHVSTIVSLTTSTTFINADVALAA